MLASLLSAPRRPHVLCTGVLAALLLPATGCLQAAAEDEPWFAIEDTGAQEETPTTGWPDRVVMDATTWTLLAVWTGEGAREQLIPMASIARIERAQAWEGRPEELVAVLKDGSRVMLARTRANVGAAATLITAVVGRQITDIPPGGEWLAAKRDDDATPATALALGSVRSAAEVTQALADADPGAPPAPASESQRVVLSVDDTLPANADPDALDKGRIKVAIKAQMGPIRTCYQRELARNAGLRGKVVVYFLIDADGSVRKAQLRETTMGNEVVESCIVDEVGKMTFPKPERGRVVPVNFPFNFTGA